MVVVVVVRHEGGGGAAAEEEKIKIVTENLNKKNMIMMIKY